MKIVLSVWSLRKWDCERPINQLKLAPGGQMKDLAHELRTACNEAKKGDTVVTIHLFGIEHADALKGLDLKALAARAGISETYGTELRKAVRLADYVRIIGKP